MGRQTRVRPAEPIRSGGAATHQDGSPEASSGTLLRAALEVHWRVVRELRTPGLLALLDDELSLQDVQLLVLVGGRGAASIGEVAASGGLSQARAGQIVDGAVRRGLVSRQHDPQDRRRVLVRLAAGGELAARRLFGHDDDRLRDCLQLMDAVDLRALAEGLEALTAALGAQEPNGTTTIAGQPDRATGELYALPPELPTRCRTEVTGADTHPDGMLG
jgi:DNA-binding MarR family transcriptional regulator